MTDEQIKLNAEVYANTILIGGLGNSPKLIAMVSFEEGAHSRDEEIKQLEFDKYLHTKRIKTQEEIIAELRNPWISVEKQLPRIGQPCFLANFDKRRCGYGKFCADDGMLTRWERAEGGSTMIYCLHEVTHWMPIPELKKGDENE